MSSHKNNQNNQQANDNISGIFKMLGSIDVNKITEVMTGINGVINNDVKDEDNIKKREEILNAVKILALSDKNILLQVIVQLYLENNSLSDSQSDGQSDNS